MTPRTRKRAYFLMMGACIGLILVAWNVVRHWSTTWAVILSVIAALLAPAAVIVGNKGVVKDHESGTRGGG